MLPWRRVTFKIWEILKNDWGNFSTKKYSFPKDFELCAKFRGVQSKPGWRYFVRFRTKFAIYILTFLGFTAERSTYKVIQTSMTIKAGHESHHELFKTWFPFSALQFTFEWSWTLGNSSAVIWHILQALQCISLWSQELSKATFYSQLQLKISIVHVNSDCSFKMISWRGIIENVTGIVKITLDIKISSEHGIIVYSSRPYAMAFMCWVSFFTLKVCEG